MPAGARVAEDTGLLVGAAAGWDAGEATLTRANRGAHPRCPAPPLLVATLLVLVLLLALVLVLVLVLVLAQAGAGWR